MTRERVIIAPNSPAPPDRAATVERARRRGFRRFAIERGDRIEAGPEEEVVVLEGDRLTVPGRPDEVVRVVSVGGPDALTEAVQSTPAGATLALEWTGDRVIPLENAIAAGGDRIHLWVFARGPREVPGALGALEHGADRVIVAIGSPAEVDALETLLEGPLPKGLAWTLAAVESVHPVGLGDRVLVDTTSLLDASEGLLVGSAAGFLFHVVSEAVGSRFSRARPFRVNAGAAHSYVLMSDGSTRYLSELDAGDSVLACRPDGLARVVRVGRVKIERRPLVVISAVAAGVRRTVFLQEAETVRLSAENARVPTTEISVGTKVYGVPMPPARHLGHTVQETIIER